MRKFRSLRAQFNAIFLGLLILTAGAAAATFAATQAQADDARVINLAGRQRMLTQQMVWLALVQTRGGDLDAAVQQFDRTLAVLRDGGTVPDAAGRALALPPVADPALRARLDAAAAAWARFRHSLGQPPPDSAALQAGAADLLAQLDAVVGIFEADARAKLDQLRLVQLASLAVSLLLLAWGYLITRWRIANPLAALGLAARQMAAGRFSVPLPAMNSDELGDLGRALETMRAELAVAHDQLETRVSRRTRELTSALEFSQEIVAQLDLDRLLRSVTDRARDLMQAQDVSLCLLTNGGAYLEIVASTSAPAVHARLRQSTHSRLTAQVVGSNQMVVSDTTCAACRFLQGCAPGQHVTVPLQASDRTLGALCTVRSDGPPFDPDELRAINLLANTAAIAITNVRLAEARQQQARQSAALAEREHLAADLHDNLAQTLSLLNLKVDQLQETVESGRASDSDDTLLHMKAVIATAYGQVRSALVDLREPSITEQDFARQLAECVASFREDSGSAADLLISDHAALNLPLVIQKQCLHIVREALTNVRRHAGATCARVCVERAGAEARFTVADDGQGFDLRAVEGHNHLGLVIMRTRAERSGGRLDIETAPGNGTKIVISFPLPETSASGETAQERE